MKKNQANTESDFVCVKKGNLLGNTLLFFCGKSCSYSSSPTATAYMHGMDTTNILDTY